MSSVPDETREAWSRRMGARMRVPDDVDPLAGTIVIAHETVHQDVDVRAGATRGGARSSSMSWQTNAR